LVVRAKKDREYFFVNNRPVDGVPMFMRPINLGFRQHFNFADRKAPRYPFVFLSLTVPPDQCDVNLTPEKRRVKLRQEEVYYEEIREMVNEIYPPPITVVPQPVVPPVSTLTMPETNDAMEGGEEEEEERTQLYPNQQQQQQQPNERPSG